MPEPIRTARVTVEAGGRRLVVSSLDKILYPATETTKGEVLHYYARIAHVLLPHLAGRPVTRVRFPHGVEGLNFFEKNIPSGAPPWLPRVTMTNTSEPITYPLVTGLDAMGPWRLLLSPDHPTPVALKTHTTEPVPYLLVDSETSGPGGTYSEAGVADEPVVPGHQLMADLLGTGV